MKENTLKICTWNLCLGLKYKLNYVKELLITEEIDILCLQETELERDFDRKSLNINGYELEIDICTDVIRSVLYVKSDINYKSIENLGQNQDLIILKIIQDLISPLFVSAIYRPWKNYNQLSQEEAFTNQVNEIERIISRNAQCIILGDFNIDYAKRNNRNIVNRRLTRTLNTLIENHSLKQVVEFKTWSRNVNGDFKSSILDHVYTNDPSKIPSVTQVSIPISDHVPVKIEYQFKSKSSRKKTMVRNWKKYSKEEWLNLLREADFTNRTYQGTPQEISNNMEIKILETLQKLAPIEEQLEKNYSYLLPPHLIKMRRKRKNLFKNAQTRNSASALKRCRMMDKEIRKLDFQNQRNKIRQKLKKGDSAALWEAVNLAKNNPSNSIPHFILSENGEVISGEERPQAFANYFEEKVKKIARDTIILNNPYMGVKRLDIGNECFFTKEKVLEVMRTLKSKKCHGYDNVPLLVLKDGAEILAEPFSVLFMKIYETKQIPDQWKISRTIPLFKKGTKKNIESYRPISNLCSASKIFEKLMLNRLTDIEAKSNIDLTGKGQHGFKRGKSTITALKAIQSQIANGIEGGLYVAMGSLDLSAAFDVVNTDLLMVRLATLGLPRDWLELLDVWLRERAAFVEISAERSMLYNINIGTVQGSVLGPVLFSLFIAPVLSLTNIVAYADDNYVVTTGKTRQEASNSIGKALTLASMWFKNSGLKVNEGKTEITLFYKNNCQFENVTVNETIIRTKDTIKVLGIIMDTTMTWHEQIHRTVNNLESRIYSLRVLQRFFEMDEMLILLKTYCYPSLYYASSVWLTPALNAQLKAKLFSASGRILSILKTTSYNKLHQEFKRATPEMWMKYELSVSLYDLIVTKQPELDYKILQQNVLNNRRSTRAHYTSTNKIRCGLNILPNRLRVISNQIETSWFGLSRDCYKQRCKNLFITTPLMLL